ncbi:MAG: aspartate-semialdehyde dehydrogenase [Nitrospira sp.]|jgi:aspartate-semialdehyde dehydrogenase|nr:aspartate-semialdehyde dehydrogenase [Nitrospira sp.]GBL39232.1 aspartate-semialdehyde dehydrogenase [Nitrospirota bacterium]MBP0121554.1 aspartate-semialdehyde dehydrogenase [Nitrospira sp.]MBP0124483.1 aspartate-semialdehyde dehydrogenase [Nitrospira sp.]MBP0126751.1 aspartate-semialdehyde dehydrogenase [Nitrospira sp.]
MLKKKTGYVVAIVGATGAVGTEMIDVLEERKFPVSRLVPLASTRSAGGMVKFDGNEVLIEVLTKDSFADVDIALFSAGADLSREFAPIAVKAGAVVIDNSAAWRMTPEVPLVVPEVNAQDISQHKGIIANPNCSTIQMVVALKPLHDKARIKRIVVTTFQSVSGTGKEAMDELMEQCQDLLSFKLPDPKVYPYQIAFNCLPQIDEFLPSGYTKEEMKMVDETRKIMGDQSIHVTATTVRVPVYVGHSEAINIETERKLTVNEARAILSTAPGVLLYDDPAHKIYPMPLEVAGKDEVYVGRIREDESISNGLNLWVVADNLRKGAALNAVQIAEHLTQG